MVFLYAETGAPCFQGIISGPTKKLWRSNSDPIARQIAANRGRSRQIAANRGKSRQIAANLQKIIFATDRIAEGIPKNNGDHFGGELLAVFGDHLFCDCMTLFYFNLRYKGGLGPGLYPTKPLSNFLPNIIRFTTMFLTLEGCQNPKI